MRWASASRSPAMIASAAWFAWVARARAASGSRGRASRGAARLVEQALGGGERRDGIAGSGGRATGRQRRLRADAGRERRERPAVRRRRHGPSPRPWPPRRARRAGGPRPRRGSMPSRSTASRRRVARAMPSCARRRAMTASERFVATRLAPAGRLGLGRGDRLVRLGVVARDRGDGRGCVGAGDPGVLGGGRRAAGTQRLELRAERLELGRRRLLEIAQLVEALLLLVEQLRGVRRAGDDLLEHPLLLGRRLRLGVVEALPDLERRPQLAGGVGDGESIGGDLVLAPLGGRELDVVGGVLERLVHGEQRPVGVLAELGVGDARLLRPSAPVEQRPRDEDAAADEEQQREDRREVEAAAGRCGLALSTGGAVSPTGGTVGRIEPVDASPSASAPATAAPAKSPSARLGSTCSPRIASISSSVTSSSASPTHSASERSSTATSSSASLPPSDEVSAVPSVKERDVLHAGRVDERDEQLDVVRVLEARRAPARSSRHRRRTGRRPGR